MNAEVSDLGVGTRACTPSRFICKLQRSGWIESRPHVEEVKMSLLSNTISQTAKKEVVGCSDVELIHRLSECWRPLLLPCRTIW